MSHVTTVDIEVRDLDALADACRACGCELVRDQKRYRWYGRHVGDYPLPEGFTANELGCCDHAIRIAGPDGARAYEVGVVRRRDGKDGFQLIYDFWGQHGAAIQKRVGDGCATLRQSYGTALVRRELKRRGYQVSEMRLANGSVQLTGRAP